MSGRLNLMSPEFWANPYPAYAELRRTSPVCQVEPGDMWAVSRYEDVLTVLGNPLLFSSKARGQQLERSGRRNLLVDSLMLEDPPRHGRLRALVSRAFNAAAVARLESFIRTTARELAGLLPSGSPVDFVTAFALPLPARVMGELLGVDPALHTQFKRWVDILVAAVPSEEDPRFQQVLDTWREVEQALREVVEQRRRHPGEDLLSELMRARVDGESLTEGELLGFCFLLLAAGLETTAHVLGHSVRVWLEHPELVARLRADPALVPRLLEEVLRYEPPVHLIARRTTAEVELAGVRLPEGATLAVLLGSACHDEARFPHPERFDLERPGLQNLPFGHGVHFCLGAMLARLEIRLGLEALLERFESLAPGGQPLQWNRPVVVRGPAALPVIFNAAGEPGLPPY